MKKKSLVMTVAALAAFTSIASAAPATSWEQGQWQVDLGVSDPKAKFDGLESDTKWNFNGGLGYALSDKWALRYDYHGLKTEAGDFKTAGDENEVNLMYSLGRNAALLQAGPASTMISMAAWHEAPMGLTALTVL